MYQLEVRNLTKRYARHTAVDAISFGIPAGQCFGLLGPNGAGKTTTIEMIEGITQPCAGDILYKGKPRDRQFKNEVGIQFQSTALMDYLSVGEVLRLFAGLYKRRADLTPLIELCHLGDFVDRDAAKLSGGQRQRLLLALALINDPEIIFLDEPTTGLDPQSRRNFWRLIDDIKAQGKTVILTTHYMDEAQFLCDQLVIMDKGKIIAEGSPEALLKHHFEQVFVCLEAGALDDVQAEQFQADRSRDQWQIASASVETTLQTLMTHQIPLTSLQIRTPTLDDLFLKLTGSQLRD
ncbi:ABC transporter ATP-binding protein [Simiduia agarivorans]|uniref:ABC transporter n=1 Tax=Simiduia agarivorans (strain DSM 21679 / JCM 13881 / BCRC 17597 / SA1) TaxID=1117647 RepID=K4KNY9_SIMAS|nr:ABC transporter ATP-binding protein [Simiduia agarivorans]AFV00722.1 ABC transporter [Simiduia agarivorans SA1 = DSM 21679]